MARATDKSKLLTVREVAERLDVAPSTVRIWRIAGRFPNAQAEETPRGRVWYIPESDLKGFERRYRLFRSEQQLGVAVTVWATACEVTHPTARPSSLLGL